MTKLRDWLSEYWSGIAIALGLLGFVALLAWAVVNAPPSCAELGGTLYQVGTRQETYKVTSVKVGEIDVPIYGTRTVPVYDCVGER